MKEKKGIFNGKIKEEYFSYILGYMIFFVVLFIALGVLCLYASLTVFAVIAFTLAFVYTFFELLVICRFPKYEKIRRIFFNSDVYFTDSNSTEYYGRQRRRDKAAFELVTSFAEAEKGMGNRKPIQYTMYLALVIVISVLGFVGLVVVPILFENGVVLSKMSDGVFALCYIFFGVICVALAIFFLVRAFKVATMASLGNDKWRHELYTSLVDIAVRKNNKKLKFWYHKDQLEQIENLVRASSENAELKLQTKRNKLVSFAVVDKWDSRVVFSGLFI